MLLKLWRQPKIVSSANVYYEYISSTQRRFNYADYGFSAQWLGFLASAYGQWRFIAPLSLDLEIGGKSNGYVPGELIDSSLILRGGISVYF